MLIFKTERSSNQWTKKTEGVCGFYRLWISLKPPFWTRSAKNASANKNEEGMILNQATDFLSSNQSNFWVGLVSFLMALILIMPVTGYAQRSGLLQRKPPTQKPPITSQLEAEMRREDIKKMMREKETSKDYKSEYKISGSLDLLEKLPPGPFRDLYKDSSSGVKKSSSGDKFMIPDFVNKNSKAFELLLNKSVIVRVDMEVTRELAEANKLAEQKKNPDILKKVIKEAKDQGEYFTARLYELDPVTRRTIMEWYNEMVKNPIKLRKLLQDMPEENMFFGVNGTVMNIVISLGDDWIVVAHLLQDGTIQLGYITNIVPPGKTRSDYIIKPLQKISDKPIEVPIAVSPQQQLQTTRILFEQKINRLNEKLKKEGKTVIVTDDIANLDIIVSDSTSIGANTVRPEEYEAFFSKEEADALRRVRDSYRRRWEDEVKKNLKGAVDSKTQKLLKDLRSDLEGKVYLQFGGETEKRTGIRWPDDIEDGTYLAVKRDEKITALSDIYRNYKIKGISDLLENYGLEFVFRGLHQASPLNDVIIINKTGRYMWLDDFIKAGFPKTIE